MEEMTKEDVIEIIKKHLKENLPDVNVEEVEPTSSMKDHGANSLDMIEVVSASMRELKIRVPRSELAEIKDIEGLAEKFLKYMKNAE